MLFLFSTTTRISLQYCPSASPSCSCLLLGFSTHKLGVCFVPLIQPAFAFFKQKLNQRVQPKIVFSTQSIFFVVQNSKLGGTYFCCVRANENYPPATAKLCTSSLFYFFPPDVCSVFPHRAAGAMVAAWRQHLFQWCASRAILLSSDCTTIVQWFHNLAHSLLLLDTRLSSDCAAILSADGSRTLHTHCSF
jgi:hypothetical protein